MWEAFYFYLKRIKRGIKSLENQIELHEKKRKIAKKEGEIELEDYFNKEINSLKKQKNGGKKFRNFY